MKSDYFPHPVIGHVDLVVQNLAGTLAFYKDVLGFQVLEQTANKVSLTTDGKTPLLTLEERKNAEPRQQQTTGLYHIAFLLPNRADLANLVHHFIQTRYQLQGASDHHVSEALYLADPEGNGLEIYVDRASEAWKWDGDQIYMTTQALDVEDLLKEATVARWQGMPMGTVIGHIHLQVADLQTSQSFYCEGLGFDPMLQYGSQALFVAKEKYHHHIGLNTWNSSGAAAPSENSTGLKCFTILLPSEEAKNHVIRQLEKLNAAVSVDGTILTKDPSGITLRLELK